MSVEACCDCTVSKRTRKMDFAGCTAYQPRFEKVPSLVEFTLRVKICLESQDQAPASVLVPRENDTIEHSSISRSGLERLALPMPQIPRCGTHLELELELYSDCSQRYMAVVVLVDYECQGDLEFTPLDLKRILRALTSKRVPWFGGYRSTAQVDLASQIQSDRQKAIDRSAAMAEAKKLNQEMVDEMLAAAKAERAKTGVQTTQQGQQGQQAQASNSGNQSSPCKDQRKKKVVAK